MPRFKASAFLSIALVICAANTVRADDSDRPNTAAMPTIQDAQSDFTAAHYKECLQKISRLLGAPMPPQPDDRYTLLTLRGECMIQQKQASIAADAFAGAATATQDEKKSALARATSDLLRKSPTLQYTPQTGKKNSPISVVEAADRKTALDAFFRDSLDTAKTDFDAIKKKQELPDVIRLAPEIAGLHSLELASTGSTKQSDELKKALQDHAKDAIDATLKKMAKQADEFAKEAAKMVQIKRQNRWGLTEYGSHRKGLTENQRTTLEGMLPTCGKIPQATSELARALSTPAGFFQPSLNEDESLIKKIHQILDGEKADKG